MRPFLLIPIVVAAVATSTPSAHAGTYPVSRTGSDVHGLFQGLNQFADGGYWLIDKPTGTRIESFPITRIAPGGFAITSMQAPVGSRFVDVTTRTEFCSTVASMYASVLAPSPELYVTTHPHPSPGCSWRTASAHIDQPMLSMLFGSNGPDGAWNVQASYVELQAFDAALTDDAPPTAVSVTSPSQGKVVGRPEVELRWSASDSLSGVATVQALGVRSSSEIGGLPAPDRRLLTGQRTRGAAAASGSAVVALPGPGPNALRVRVTDGAGNSTESAPLTVTYVEPPRALRPPAIRGTAMPGSALTCDGGSWADPAPTLAYAWLRDGLPIPGASALTYTVATADVGRELTCRVTAANAGTAVGGAPTQSASAPVAAVAWPSPILESAPVLHGTATPGSTLTCDPGRWREPQPALAIAWRLDGAVVGAGPTYVPAAADVGRQVDCRVTATGPGTPPGEAVVATGTVRIEATPGPEVLAGPTVRGAARQGGTVTCDPGRWREPQPAVAIAWRLDGVVVAQGATYAPRAADVGRDLDCRVVASGRGTPPATTTLTTPAVRVAPAAGAGIVAVAYAGKVALRPDRPDTVAASGPIQLEGRVQAGEEAGPVVVEVRFPGTATQRWSVPLQADGRFSAIVRPARGGDLVVRYAGDASTAPAEVRAAELRVRPRVTATFRARRAGAGLVRTLTVQGRVSPAPGVAVRLAWQGQPRGRGAWQAFCRATGIVVAADGRFSGRCGIAGRLFATNRYRVVLQADPLGPHAAAASTARKAVAPR